MIYFDNAATTAQKPPEVAEAVARAINGFGGVGRGAHEASLDAGAAVFQTRERIARLLGAADASRVAFTCNATEALNSAIAGLLRPGEHAITTAASHNSVLRPLYRKQDEHQCGLSVVPINANGSLDYDQFEAAFQPGTRLAVVTHASNLTGDIYDIARIARICHKHGALLLVDAAQTAGFIPINMMRDAIDLVAFTGHKSLYGPQGTGGLAVAEGVEVPPFKVGGTGAHSYDRRHPACMPESLEAGTLNAHGIAGLGAGLAYLEREGVDKLAARVRFLTQTFESGVREIPGVQVYGEGVDRCGIVALNVGDVDAAVISDVLSVEFGVGTRSGAHCAPLMHEALGTQDQGAVRFSFSSFNTGDEVLAGIRALAAIAKES